MAASLTTDCRDDGVHCTTDDGETLYVITYQMTPGGSWHVTTPSSGEPLGRAWLTLEAAEFYALALYAESRCIQGHAAA